MKKWIGIVLSGTLAVGIVAGVSVYFMGSGMPSSKKESFLFKGNGYSAEVLIDRPVIVDKKVIRQKRTEKWRVFQKEKDRTLIETSFNGKVYGHLSFSQDEKVYRQDSSTENWEIPLDLATTDQGKLKGKKKDYRVGKTVFPVIYEYEMKRKESTRIVFVAPKFGVVKEVQKTQQNRTIYSMQMVNVSLKK